MRRSGQNINWTSPVTGAAVVGGAFFAVALLVAWSGVSLRETEQSVAGWPAVPGTLLEAGVVYDYVAKRNTPKQWQPAIRYRYSVQGVEHEGRTLFWGDEASGDRDVVEQNMRRVLGAPYDAPLPRPVTVYFSPADPRLAVLERINYSNSSYGAFAVAAFCALVGAIVVVSFLQRAARRK